MNYLHHPNLLVHFWAAVNSEFDKILDGFVRGDGWLFQDLGNIARKANIGDIHRCIGTVVNGIQGKEERVDHFIRVNFVILDVAKSQWLAPWRNYVVDPTKGFVPPFLKRQVGGFFLLYMLYISQPLPNRCKKRQRIVMDSKDLISMHVFNNTIRRLPKSNDQFKELTRQIVILFNDLVSSGSFEFAVTNDTFTTPCNSVRQLLSNKYCLFTKMVFVLKDLRDQLYYVTYHESTNVFRSLVAYGKYLPQKKQKKSPPKKYKNDTRTNRTESEGDFPRDKKKWSLEEIHALENEKDIGKIAHSVASILKSLDFGPILTRERVTGISENLLDKEMDHCIKTYVSKRKTQEINILKTREHKHAMEGNRHARSETCMLKKYYADDNEWIEQIFRGEHPGSMEANITTEDSLLAKKEEDVDVVNLVNSDEGEDCWITDDDDNEFEDCLEMPKLKKEHTEKSSKSPSPRKKGPYLSMPMIM